MSRSRLAALSFVSAARKAAKTLLVSAAALLLAPLAGSRASASPKARLNVNVAMQGIALVSDLKAQTGGTPGTINLSWTEPGTSLTVAPNSYEVKISSLAQISNNVDFSTNAALSAFSPAVIPAPGPGGGGAGFVVNGLTPGVTYFFGLREVDSDAPQHVGVWSRSVPKGWNPNNFAQANFIPHPPDQITDLVAQNTFSPGQVRLSWTAPQNTNGVPMSRYILKYSTQSAADLGGDTTAWFNLATATTVIVSPAHGPGFGEVLMINGLPGVAHYFGIKSIDITDYVSDVDTKTMSVVNQANTAPKSTIEIFASTGPVSGSVTLTWDEPFTGGLVLPVSYTIKVSSAANLSDNAQFSAAQPLSTFSRTEVPAPGGGGARVNLTVTGLVPGTTYFFAIREQDSDSPPFQTNWQRGGTPFANPKNFAPAHFIPHDPDAVTDLTAAPGAGVESRVTLTWTAPGNPNFVPMSAYQVRYATYSAASLAGDTTAWFNAATSSHTVSAVQPGSLVTLHLDGLFPLSTFYFAVRGVDVRGETSLIDTRTANGFQPFSMPMNLPPATPSGFTGTAGLVKAQLSWTDMTTAQKTFAFAFYKLYRSTDPANSFVQITTTTGTSYLDRPLFAFATYYYKVAGSEGFGGYDGVPTSTVAVVPYTLPPQEPFGFRVTPTSSTVSFAWNNVVRYSDGEPFISTATPSIDELTGYVIQRSTSICVPNFAQVSTTTVGVTTFTDVTNGAGYFYQIRSRNSLGVSTSTLVLSSLGDQHYFLDDCASQVVLTNEMTYALSASSNGLGGDIMISRVRRPADVGGTVLQSIEFKPLLNGVSELKGWYLPKPARITLHFATQGGSAVPDTRPVGLGLQSVAEAGLGVQANGASSLKNLGAYWDNGQEFKKVYGTVDELGQTVEVQSPNLGVYQVRSMLRSDTAVFDLSNISGRVITPNGDGKNDSVIFTYDPGPRGVVPEGKIYDVRGGFVASMTPGFVPNTLTWDGYMNGRPVTSGVYVYQIKGDGKTFSGTIVVAR